MNATQKTILTTLAKAFLIGTLTQLLAVGTGILTLDAQGWKTVLASGLAAVIVVAYKALNPADPSLGVGRDRQPDSLPTDGSDFDPGTPRPADTPADTPADMAGDIDVDDAAGSGDAQVDGDAI